MCCWSFCCIFQPKDEEQEFIVGDNSSVSGGFWNLPLTPGRWYQVTLVGINRQDDDFKYSIVKLHHSVQIFSEANVEADSGSETLWAPMLLLLLIPAIVYFICRSVVWIIFVTALGRQVAEIKCHCLQQVWDHFFTTTANMSLKLASFCLQIGTNVLAYRVYYISTLDSSLFKQF
jgi:hypothetical protein